MKILAQALVLVTPITFEQFTILLISDNYTGLINLSGFYVNPMTLQTWKFLEHKKMHKMNSQKYFLDDFLFI